MKVLIKFVMDIVILFGTAWLIMLFEGIIAAPHHLYTIGYGEAVLALLIIGNVVGYSTHAVLNMLENR